jgi:hypothetical protein
MQVSFSIHFFFLIEKTAIFISSDLVLGAYQKSLRKNPELVEIWDDIGGAKIAVKANSEEEL